MHKLESVQGNETHKLQWDFDIKKGSHNLGQTTKSYDDKKREHAAL